MAKGTNAATEPWGERYLEGSEEAESRLFELLASEMLKVQEIVAAQTGMRRRTLHSKILVGVQNAHITIDGALPSEFAVGYFRPGVTLPASVRFSSASSFIRDDGKPDMRGLAIRVGSEGGCHDLLMTSFPVSHARNARQFVDIAKISIGAKTLVIPRLIVAIGLSETIRVVRNIRLARSTAKSLAAQPFWSRAPILWGESPVRYMVRPCSDVTEIALVADGTDYFEKDLAARLKIGAVKFRLALQRFVDQRLTPVEDGAAEWAERDSPPIEVATVVIPQQDLLSKDGRKAKDAVDLIAFNPWNHPGQFRPLGNLNRARCPVYNASATGWNK